MNSLQSLRELQLLVLGLEMYNLANIYQFLEACRCSNLERLFVQVSIFLHLYESLRLVAFLVILLNLHLHSYLLRCFCMIVVNPCSSR
jgi:hypothetical protein